MGTGLNRRGFLKGIIGGSRAYRGCSGPESEVQSGPRQGDSRILALHGGYSLC